MMTLHHRERGSIMFQVLIFGAIAFIFIGGLIAWANGNVKYSKQLYNREQTIEIAEAGIEYYRFRLAHDPNDFQDGTGVPGPYVHAYSDAGGNRIGEFSLDITPPTDGFN